MKLEVGMYCRTENGTIFKIVGGNIDHWDIDITYGYLSKCEDYDYSSYAYNKNNSLFEGLVTKPSFNIIDILEVKDIIEIDVIDEDNYSHILGINFIRIENERDLSNIKDMISNESARLIQIVTHEQFEQMSYKLGE